MTERLPRHELDRLFGAVCGRDTTPGAVERQVIRAVYGLLGDGQPVTAARLAATVGVDPARAASWLDQLPNSERDDDGAVVGFGGLTLRPTPYRLTVDGRVRYAWCAWDTLFLPTALNAEIRVDARCAHTGRPVTLRVAPTGVVDRVPDRVAVSFVQPSAIDTADVRGSFCSAVHFLTDATAAVDLIGRSRSRLVLDLDDAFELGRRMMVERCGPPAQPHRRVGRRE